MMLLFARLYGSSKTDEQAWSTVGIILIAENRSTQGKTCPSASLPTKNPTQNGLVLNPNLQVGGQQLTI
jgi:hypothetical protein